MKPITEQRRQEPDFFVVVTSAGIWQSFHKCRADAEFITSKPFNPGYSILEIYTAPPVPVIKLPEKLPCDVRFDPGMIFRKGVLVQTMLDALVRRDDYEKELAELSEDERKARQEKISEFLNGLGE